MPDEHHADGRIRPRGHPLQHRRARNGRTRGADRCRRQHRRRQRIRTDDRQRRGVVVDQQHRGIGVGAPDQRRGRLGLRHHLDVLDAGTQQFLTQGVGLRRVGQAQPRRGQPVTRLGHRTEGADDGVGQVGHRVVGQVEGVLVVHLATVGRRPDHRQASHPIGDRHPQDHVHRTTPCLTR